MQTAIVLSLASALFINSSVPYYRAQLELEAAWAFTKGNPNVKVAVLSTGVNYRLPELEKSIALNEGEIGNGRETDGIDNDKNGYIDDVYGANTFKATGDPIDQNGLGTFEASLIVSPEYGLAPGVKIIPVAICDEMGTCSSESLIKGIQYATQRGASIIYMSVGGNTNEETLNAECEAIKQAKVPVIAAAGSEALDLDHLVPNREFGYRFPVECQASNLLVVTASDENSKIASFANYGQIKVHLAAPGLNIPGLNQYGQKVHYSGGSVAGVITASVGALVASLHPEYNPLQIKAALMGGVDQSQLLKDKVMSGGRLNALRSLNLPLR